MAASVNPHDPPRPAPAHRDRDEAGGLPARARRAGGHRARHELGLDPHTGLTVVFRSKRGDRMKVLVWDGEPDRGSVRGTDPPANGLVMIYKRLDAGAFAWPTVRDGVMRISWAQYEALFEGLDWRRVMARRVPAPTAAS